MAVRVGDVGRAMSALSPSGASRSTARGSTRGRRRVHRGRMHDRRRSRRPNRLRRPQARPRFATLAQPRSADSEGRVPTESHGGAAAENNEERERLKELQSRRVAARSGRPCWRGRGRHSARWACTSTGPASPVAPATLYGASAAAGAGWAVALYFFTGWFVARVMPAEEGAGFEPNLVAVAVGLIVAALGFWVTFASGHVLAIAAQTTGISLAFPAAAPALSCLVTCTARLTTTHMTPIGFVTRSAFGSPSFLEATMLDPSRFGTLARCGGRL